MCGDRVVLDSVEGLLKSHRRPGGSVGEWTGHFEVPGTEREPLRDGHRYRIVLIDGRSGTVSVHLSHKDPQAKPLAQFHGTGSFRG